MNKKIVAVVIAIFLIIGGIYFFVNRNYLSNNINQPKNEDQQSSDNAKKEDSSENEDIIEGQEIEDENYNKNIDIEVGKEAPNFTLKNLEGKEVSLSDYRGKIVFINFWATWCKYCDIEMPDLQKIDNENEDVVVLAVDVMEDKKKVSKYIEKGGYEFEVVLDEKGDIARNYLVSAFPTSYFVDKDGTLMGGVPGMMEYAQMNEILENIRKK